MQFAVFAQRDDPAVQRATVHRRRGAGLAIGLLLVQLLDDQKGFLPDRHAIDDDANDTLAIECARLAEFGKPTWIDRHLGIELRATRPPADHRDP